MLSGSALFQYQGQVFHCPPRPQIPTLTTSPSLRHCRPSTSHPTCTFIRICIPFPPVGALEVLPVVKATASRLFYSHFLSPGRCPANHSSLTECFQPHPLCFLASASTYNQVSSPKCKPPVSSDPPLSPAFLTGAQWLITSLCPIHSENQQQGDKTGA